MWANLATGLFDFRPLAHSNKGSEENGTSYFETGQLGPFILASLITYKVVLCRLYQGIGLADEAIPTMCIALLLI